MSIRECFPFALLPRPSSGEIGCGVCDRIQCVCVLMCGLIGFRRMETCIKLFHHSLFGAVGGTMDDAGGGEDEEDANGRRVRRRGSKTGDEKAENGRRINVELTCGFSLPFPSISPSYPPAMIEPTLTLLPWVDCSVGGGGSKSVARKSKIRAKNEKLGEERKRRATAAAVAASKGHGKPKAQRTENIQEEEQEEENHIHPSRRLNMTK